MHVAVFGAGALGSVYGVRLATHGAATVSFVVRPARVSSREPVAIELVRDARKGRPARDVIASPLRVASIPADADVVLLAVGAEALEAIRPVLAASNAPVVVLTPMMPVEWRAMRDAFGERVLAAMPNVISYTSDEGVVRYWLAPAPTRIDEPRAGDDGDVVRELARALSAAGLRTHLEMAVHELNPATTVCFIPVAMGVCLAGSLEALARDVELAELVQRACREGVDLAPRIGRSEPLSPLAPLAASPLVLRAAVAYLRRRSPEALHYVDVHFGVKLLEQHRRMALAMTELAIAKDMPHASIKELAVRLDQLAGRV